jgi:hypothetical protein
MQRLEERGHKSREAWLLTFEKLLSETGFAKLMQRMLKTLEDKYQYPVDVEFTVNLAKDDVPKINLVQCRPLQTRGFEKSVQIPQDLPVDRVLFHSEGHFMGGNVVQPVRCIIWVEPAGYCLLPLTDKYEIARIVGRLNKKICNQQNMPTLLMGPGRWGTTTPSLGIPVGFSEINNVSILAEVAFPAGGLMPELSFGSHFFQDLVETEIFYLALFPEDGHCTFNPGFLDTYANRLDDVEPSAGRFKDIVKVVFLDEGELQVISDVLAQRVVCFC